MLTTSQASYIKKKKVYLRCSDFITGLFNKKLKIQIQNANTKFLNVKVI